MGDSDKYTPLSQRIQQDVWHDNFVPKYSALASAKPSKLVLMGVWMIFAPMAVGSFLLGLSHLAESRDWLTATMVSINAIFFCALAVAILYRQTQRFWTAALLDHEDDSDGDDRYRPDNGG